MLYISTVCGDLIPVSCSRDDYVFHVSRINGDTLGDDGNALTGDIWNLDDEEFEMTDKQLLEELGYGKVFDVANDNERIYVARNK